MKTTKIDRDRLRRTFSGEHDDLDESDMYNFWLSGDLFDLLDDIDELIVERDAAHHRLGELILGKERERP